MAGTGKTTIAYSVCEQLESSGHPIVSFFCDRRLPECRDVRLVVPNISYQLCSLRDHFRSTISGLINEDVEVHNWPISQQFERLVATPLRKTGSTFSANPVVVIDGLEECEDRDGVDEILRVLVANVPGLPVKVLVTGRPTLNVDTFMRESRSGWDLAELRLHELLLPSVQRDIEAYLWSRLEHISPSGEEIEGLASQSGGLFKHATFCAQYILRTDAAKDVEMMQQLLGSPSVRYSDGQTDALYTAILEVAFGGRISGESDLADVMRVLHAVVCASEPLTESMLVGLPGLSGASSVGAILETLGLILQIVGPSGRVAVRYESFVNYIRDPALSGRFYCNIEQHAAWLAEVCFSLIKAPTHAYNICNLTSSYLKDRDVPDIEQKVSDAIADQLLHACRNLGTHITPLDGSDRHLDMIHDFLSTRLLLWMEVLNLKCCMRDGAEQLRKMSSWLKKNKCLNTTTLPLLEDAQSFVAAFMLSPLSEYTPHIYVSALPLWPNDRPISQHYMSKMTRLVKLVDTSVRQQPRRVYFTGLPIQCVTCSPSGDYIAASANDAIWILDTHTQQFVGQPLQGHKSPVLSVAYSPDGAYIVSGSLDYSIRIWDAHTGQPIGKPLHGHTSSVLSVACSPDGAYIAAGGGCTIRIWNAYSRKLICKPLKGHTGLVDSVVYRPDGAHIASGSADHTIRIWDAHTGQPIGKPLEGHMFSVNSIAYSPDGAYIASGSWDNTVRIWDAQNGKPIGNPLSGHIYLVRSVTYSPDGAYIASGSDDGTIRIWDVRTSQLIGRLFGSLTSPVNSVKYSADGAYIASGSSDHTIGIWNTRTRPLIGEPLEGHTAAVYSVACSPNGAFIASGSGDCTVRIWDARTGQSVGKPLKGHTSQANSVAYSPDGAYIVSGSSDCTIRVWNARSGQPVGGPLEGRTQVLSVAYSPDGAYIASGLRDFTVRIWDVRTGKPVGKPLVGHPSPVCSVAYSPDGAYIASGSADYTIRIWDAHTGQPVGKPLGGDINEFLSVAYSPDGAYIASGSQDDLICIWSARTGKPAGKPLSGHTDKVHSVAYSSDGSRIVSGSLDGTIRVWDAHSRQPVGKPLKGHTGSVSSVAYSPDGSYIVSGSSDHTIRIWNVPTQHHTSPPSRRLKLPTRPDAYRDAQDRERRDWHATAMSMRRWSGEGIPPEPDAYTKSIYSQSMHVINPYPAALPPNISFPFAPHVPQQCSINRLVVDPVQSQRKIGQ
ncbi:hypothetical protein FRC09_003385 [Ceratobasidium sp. 395]|nr:hypothetical protein FRC09_003385 [Ceratobasidium sp. 395]